MSKEKAYIGDEKTIKDYLHLYLGCDVERQKAEYFIGVGMVKKGDIQRLGPLTLESALNDPDKFKPILRPLSDMTEEEWKKCFELARGIFDQAISDKIQQMSSTEVMFTLGKAQFIFGYHNCFENDVRIGSGLCFFMKRYLIKEVLQVSDGGLEDGDSQFNDLTIEPVDNINHIFIYLLSKDFDLFGLIDAGLAIDKTTLNKQS